MLSPTHIKIGARDFDRLKEIIYKVCGINITESKNVLVQSRLQKRLSHLGLNSFTEYCDHLLYSPEGKNEVEHLINAIATNKTDFLREPSHFEFLQQIVPTMVSQDNFSELNVWSAACSTGEEPYTIAMVLSNTKLTYTLPVQDTRYRCLNEGAERSAKRNL